MKKLLTLIITGSLSIACAIAQDSETEKTASTASDTTKLKIGKKRILIMNNDQIDIGAYKTEANDTLNENEDEMKENRCWGGIELGIAGYATPSHTLKPAPDFDFLELDYARSVSLNINPLEGKIKLIKKYVALISGIGLGFNSYAFKKDIVLDPDAQVIAALTDSAVTYQKNKLKTSWVNVPVMLAFNTSVNPKKSWRLAFGLVGGFKLGSKTKQKYTEGNTKYKPKIKADYNLLPYHYSARAVVGYGKVNIYASYALSSFFEEDEGPELHPFTVGVRLMAI